MCKHELSAQIKNETHRQMFSASSAAGLRKSLARAFSRLKISSHQTLSETADRRRKRDERHNGDAFFCCDDES
jgi:hypothetical protein